MSFLVFYSEKVVTFEGKLHCIMEIKARSQERTGSAGTEVSVSHLTEVYQPLRRTAQKYPPLQNVSSEPRKPEENQLFLRKIIRQMSEMEDAASGLRTCEYL